jgi:hypothetical protein
MIASAQRGARSAGGFTFLDPQLARDIVVYAMTTFSKDRFTSASILRQARQRE